MKKYLVIMALLVSAATQAQVSNRIFFSQLMVVFSDMENHFDYLRGELQDTRDGDSLSSSNSTLEGTVDNNIFISGGGNAYQAMVNDSTSLEGAQLVMQAWKQKLEDVLNGSLKQPAEAYQSTAEKEAEGFEYNLEKAKVMLIRHKTDQGWFWINLVITPN